MNAPPLADALKHSDVIHDRRAIETAIAKMSVRIRNDYAGSVPL